MLSTLLAIVLSQTAPTDAQVVGALNTLQATVLSARRGERQITAPGSGKRICIRPLGALPQGTSIIRFGVSFIAGSFAQFVGLPVHGRVPTQDFDPTQFGTITRTLTTAERWQRSPDEHTVIEVQAVPTTARAYDRALWAGNMDVIEAEVSVEAFAKWPICEVAMYRNDDAEYDTGVRCACWDGTRACTWQRPNANGGGTTPVACPRGLTMAPGSFSGVGAVAKACIARFDGNSIDMSWPAACPQ